MSIDRQAARSAVATALGRSAVTLLSGPRQCGKTTFAREFLLPGDANFFDREDP